MKCLYRLFGFDPSRMSVKEEIGVGYKSGFVDKEGTLMKKK